MDRKLLQLGLALALAVTVCTDAGAQVPPKAPQPPPDNLMVKGGRAQPPQIVTVVHRVNGIKALVLMQRSGETVATVDDNLFTSADAVTSITAGFAIGDGQSVVARLWQAQAEAEAMIPPMTWSSSVATSAGFNRGPTPPAERAEFVVVESNGKQLAARYIGLDGGSGLSLLQIPGLKVPLSRDVVEDTLTVGQRVRVVAPARAGVSAPNTEQGTVSVRVGEIEGRISEITRTSGGGIAHLTVTAQDLSAAIVGGITLNDAGEIVGIVETTSSGRARLTPIAAVRRAAGRVLARRSSVPRPWLGVRGEAVWATPLEKFHLIGWTAAEATKLKQSYEGILLTSVAPGTPAALADLRRGDVIVRVNDLAVKSAEDFSYLLNEAGSGATVNFTFFRGQKDKPSVGFGSAPTPAAAPAPPTALSQPFPIFKPLEVSVKMGEAFNPARAMRLAEAYGMSIRSPNALPPIARGLETVKLSSKAAAHLGARGGMLVVFVDPESAAARADLRVFDVIESVDGRLPGTAPWSATLLKGDQQQLLLGVVRDRQKLKITIQQKVTPKR